jgi:hypothetical protein
MATYQNCGPEVGRMVKDLIADHYPELEEAGVTIHCQYAYAARNKDGEPKGPALRFGNYPAAAIVRVNSHKHRVQGEKDATIEIDGDHWEELTEAEQVALLDHEICHLEVLRDREGAVKTDNCGRPRLKCRQHDFQIGAFVSVMRRHGPAALEAQALMTASREYVQALFDWDKPATVPLRNAQ